jgi:hypothetical protein
MSSTALSVLSVGFMVRRAHAGQVFILHRNIPPPFSCTKISALPLLFPPAPPCN